MTMEKWIKLALREAEKAFVKDEVPIGAVIVCDGKVIARGHNLKENSQKATKHAEIVAIEKACKRLKSWRLDNCEIYVTIEPCPMCVGAIIQARIPVVGFGAYDKKFGALGSVIDLFAIKGWNHYPKVVNGGVLATECSLIMKRYFALKRK
jgi:tRNA(adenine34) deaminase